MENLPPELLPTVPHVTFLIFNWTIPNIIIWAIIIIGVIAAAWFRLPKIFD